MYDIDRQWGEGRRKKKGDRMNEKKWWRMMFDDDDTVAGGRRLDNVVVRSRMKWIRYQNEME